MKFRHFKNDQNKSKQSFKNVIDCIQVHRTLTATFNHQIAFIQKNMAQYLKEKKCVLYVSITFTFKVNKIHFSTYIHPKNMHNFKKSCG